MNNYKLVNKDPKKQPSTGVYSDWKPQISDECHKHCVYCTIHESNWGGMDHYHIDHFRPKSKAAFASLINDICNLFYACPVCNRFKSDDWPADPDLNIVSYPDPSITDYSKIFDINTATYTISGKNVSANYVVTRLYLNRPQLVYERRETFLKANEEKLFQEVIELALKTSDLDLIRKTFTTIAAIKTHLDKRKDIRPYKLSEIRKP